MGTDLSIKHGSAPLEAGGGGGCEAAVSGADSRGRALRRAMTKASISIMTWRDA